MSRRSGASKVALVTGANAGIGLETARGLARLGYEVILLCRNPQRAADAAADIRSTVPDASLEVVRCDLGDLSAVHAAVGEIQCRYASLDVLVNNAGLKLRPPRQMAHGHEIMLGANVLGPFLLTTMLLPLLCQSPQARIVTVSSAAHRFGHVDFSDIEAQRGYGFRGWRRYGDTKLMNILLTRAFARRLAETAITANSLHPGAVNTPMATRSKLFAMTVAPMLRTAEEGARTSLYVATAPELAGITGSFFMNSKRADHKLGANAQRDDVGERLWAWASAATGHG